MSRRFTRHYTREEARVLLPHVRRWVQRIRELQYLRDHLDAEAARMFSQGRDLGGARADRWTRQTIELQGIADELLEHQIQVEDLEPGRVDFPSLIEGREVFLCWQEGEDDVEYWHELDAGVGGGGGIRFERFRGARIQFDRRSLTAGVQEYGKTPGYPEGNVGLGNRPWGRPAAPATKEQRA